MSITFPSSPSFRAINLKMQDPTVKFKAQSGKRMVRKVGGQYWSLTLTYPSMTRDTFSPVLAAIVKARGSYQTFTIIPPNYATPRGTQVGDTSVKTSTNAGSLSVPVSGATPLATFKAGDLLKFSNHSKVYMLTDDATADGVGEATLTFNPPLISSVVGSSTTIKHASVPFTVALNNDLQEIKTDVAGFYTFELDVEEAI